MIFCLFGRFWCLIGYKLREIADICDETSLFEVCVVDIMIRYVFTLTVTLKFKEIWEAMDMLQKTMDYLRSTADFYRFDKDEYICHEGQQGDSMYIVLQGTIGVFLTDPNGMQTEVSRIESGGFFGEMSIFDKMPRSASCIALEDSICVAINKNNLSQFLLNCPDIVEQLLMSMSLRVRKMDEMMHSAQAAIMKKAEYAPFEVPEEFHNHKIGDPKQDPKYFQIVKEECPVCGEQFSVIRVRRNKLSVQLVTPDQRVRYEDCEPLWHEVITCPHCLYSNYYLNFFHVNSENREAVRNVLHEQYPTASKLYRHGTAADRGVLAYLQAIHLNEQIRAADSALLGLLWLRLYRIACDGENSPLVDVCAQNAAQYLCAAFDQDQITNPTDRYTLLMALSYLLVRLDSPDLAKHYCSMVLNCPNPKIRTAASALVNKLQR